MDAWYVIAIALSGTLLFALIVRYEISQPVWKLLCEKFPSSDRSIKIAEEAPLYIWFSQNSSPKRATFNAIEFSPGEKGLGLYAPKWKPWMRSVYIPWHQLQLDTESSKGLSSIVVRVSDLDVSIVIPRRYKSVVESKLDD